MREDLTQIQEIENYLMGKLSSSEKQAFEARINANPALKASVEQQLLIMEASNRLVIKQNIKKGKRTFKTKRFFKAAGIGLAVVAIGIASFYFLTKGNSEMANINLPQQEYVIQNITDTVIETVAGMNVVIPADAFEDENGNPVTSNIDFQIKEAFETYDIIKSGLTTLSNGELLETGGMFFLEAFSHGEKLRLRKGKEIFLDIPNINPKEGMMLFDGEYKPNGEVNWVKPKPFEKDLVTYDITTLDFYPEGYPEVIDWEAKNVLTYAANDIPSGVDMTEEEAIKLGLIIRDSTMSYSKSGVNSFYPKPYTDSLYYSYAGLFAEKTLKPKAIEYGNRRISSVYSNSDKMVLFFENNMDSLIISKKDYQDNEDRVKDSLFNIYGCKLNILFSRCRDVIKEEPKASCTPTGINPAKIKAIWNKQYNNTILATKEFEERLKVIHEERQDGILNIYIANIDKPLWYSDSIANDLSGGKFKAFYAQRKGGVKIKDELANTLSRYYERTQKEITEQSSKLFNDFQKKKRELIQSFSKKKTEKNQEEFTRKMKVFKEELEVNLNEAYRQLGKTRPSINNTANVIKRGRLRVRTSTLGPKNVDQYVYAATQNRRSLGYTDPNTNKTATIAYNEVELTITNNESFDKVFVYMIPNGLNSFNRMEASNSKTYKGSLNELFKYGTFCLAYVGDQAYYYEGTLSKGSKQVQLIAISESDLKTKLNKSQKGSDAGIKSDVDFYKEELIFKEERNTQQASDQLTLKVGRFLFPDIGESCFIERVESRNNSEIIIYNGIAQ